MSQKPIIGKIFLKQIAAYIEQLRIAHPDEWLAYFRQNGAKAHTPLNQWKCYRCFLRTSLFPQKFGLQEAPISFSSIGDI